MPPAPAEPARRRRRWPYVVLIVLVVIGGCTAGAIYLGMRVAGSMSAPVDTANAYLDAARAGQDTASLTCEDRLAVDPDIAASQGQRLTNVHVSNNRDADVGGSLTLADGERVPIDVRLRRVDDEWCITDVRLVWGR